MQVPKPSAILFRRTSTIALHKAVTPSPRDHHAQPSALGGDTGKADASRGAIEGGGRRCRGMRIVDNDRRRESGGETYRDPR